MNTRDTVTDKGAEPVSPDQLTRLRSSQGAGPGPSEKQNEPPATGPPPHGSDVAVEAQTSDDEDVDDEDSYPEGGLQAWLVVLGAWLALFSALGLMNTLATFQAYVATHQLKDHTEGQIGWIFSLYTFLTFFCGIYIGPTFDRYGPRWVILGGTLCLVVSLVGLSFCTGTSAIIRIRDSLALSSQGYEQ